MKIKRLYASIASVLMMGIIFILFIIFVKSSVDFDALSEMTFDDYELNQELSDIDDGIYFGRHEIFPLSIQVHVYIIDHEISDIVMHGHSLFFDEDAFDITNEIIDLQSFNLEFNQEHDSSEKILVLAIINAIEEELIVESIST